MKVKVIGEVFKFFFKFVKLLKFATYKQNVP